MQMGVDSIQIRGRDYWSVWKQFVLHGAMQDEAIHPALLQQTLPERTRQRAIRLRQLRSHSARTH